METVQNMQDYIKEHFREDDFCIDDVCAAVGYSRRHAERIFRRYIGKSLQDYMNAVCLSQSAQDLIHTKDSVLELAFKSHFQSHEGFTRSFTKRFHVTPAEYRENQIPIPLFVQYPISHYDALLKYKEGTFMSEELALCMITAKERSKRKLIYLCSKQAEDYFSYCEEMGCEWEGLLNSIPEKYDSAALIELPDYLVRDGVSKVAAGIEVPLNYDKPIPDGYETAELCECTMLYFQTEPYEDENEFCKAIESAYGALAKYNPRIYGYRFAYEIAPCFNFGADAVSGARIAVPAVRE